MLAAAVLWRPPEREDDVALALARSGSQKLSAGCTHGPLQGELGSSFREMEGLALEQ